jgi:transcriptional regulator with XRE-family HTH domain
MTKNIMGSWLREQRISRGLTQEHVAAALGLSQPGYSNIERGNVALSGKYITVISELLGVPWQEIMDRRMGLLTEVERAILKDKHLSASDSRLLLLIYGDRTGRNSAALTPSVIGADVMGTDS